MTADLSFITYFAPIWVFLAVFGITYGLLFKTKILGENKWPLLFVSFVIATIFISAASIEQYVSTVIPWMVILILALFFILLLTSFVGEDTKFMNKGIGIALVILVMVIFVISGVKVFYSVLSPYFPGSSVYGEGVGPEQIIFIEWLFSGPVIGALFLLILSGIVSWILVKGN